MPLLVQVEDACINASAPPQQRWLDGWLLRAQPGKARRARCIHALAPGRLPLATRLARAAEHYRDAGLPLIFRITPFTHPPGLDADLAALGFAHADNTHVLIYRTLKSPQQHPLPQGLGWTTLSATALAEAVGELRHSPPAHRQAHAQRLLQSPVLHRACAIQRVADGRVLCCGQFAVDGPLVGLYDVFTHPDARGQGLASQLCERLLHDAATRGAKTAYLQVDAGNDAALRVYRRLGFEPGYDYHYRESPLS